MRTLYPAVCTLVFLLGLSSCDSGSSDSGFTGYIEADLIYVSASLPGRIEALPFEQGDAVSAVSLC